MMVDETRRRMLATVGGTVAVGLAGCGSPDDGGDNETEATETEMTETEMGGGMNETEMTETEMTESGMAMVRVAHMSPDAPNVDVLVDGEPVLEDVAFGTVSDYLELEPGTYPVQITAAGDPSTVVFDEEVPVEAAAYTLVAAGETAEENQPFEVLILEDDTSAPSSGQSRVRLVHASPDAPEVDVTTDGMALFESVAYGETATETVSAGQYTLAVRPATENNDGDVVDEFDVELAPETGYTVFAAGYLEPDEAPGTEPFALVVAEDTPS